MTALHLRLNDVSLEFDGALPLLHKIDLSITSRSGAPGDFIVIEGPSGSGKSSLLRLLNRLVDPTDGEFLVDGTSARTLPVPPFRRRVQLLQQTPVILPETVRVNLRFGDRFVANPMRDDDSSLRTSLDDVGLTEADLDSDAEPLSVGQRQRLALARVLRAGPQILLADEPTSALDEASSQIVLDRIESLCVDEGVAIVLVTHQRFTPRRVAVQHLRLADGCLEQG